MVAQDVGLRNLTLRGHLPVSNSYFYDLTLVSHLLSITVVECLYYFKNIW